MAAGPAIRFVCQVCLGFRQYSLKIVTLSGLDFFFSKG